MTRGSVAPGLSGCLLFAAACLCLACPSGGELKKRTIRITRSDGSQVSVVAEIADTEESRERGFMWREVVPDGTGMLFVFEKSQLLSFWMKNTPHPLSIAYIDSRGVIRNIYDMTPFSEASWSSTDFVQYALEVSQGWFARNGIETGDTVDLDGAGL